MNLRCPRHVHWWDLETDVQCGLESGHHGDHTDGDRWWDAHGLQTPRNVDPPAPRFGVLITRQLSARLTDAEVIAIRVRYQAGSTFAAIARELALDYNTVRSCALRLTYRSVA